MMRRSPQSGILTDRPTVAVVGGGFGGVECARALRKANANVVLIDRNNHSLFQPLLYQVATGVLTDSAIASPLRRIFERQSNATVLLADVKHIDVSARTLHFEDGTFSWDHLVLAAGMQNNYFGNDDWEHCAPGMKNLAEATRVRARILEAFEQAERAFTLGNHHEVDACLTFVVVGGGATGVELSGAIKQLAVDRIAGGFKSLDVSRTRVLLVDGGSRLLSGMSAQSSTSAQRILESYGVEVRLNTSVTSVTPEGVVANDETIKSRTVIWAAGVTGSPLAAQVAEQLGLSPAHGGRVPVNPDLTVATNATVRVIGDLAQLTDPKTGADIPGVAQGALQMGTYAGRAIRRELAGRTHSGASTPFRYRDKGMMATVGKGRAVLDAFGLHLSGFVAWLVWALVHIAFLINIRSRFAAIWSWSWAYVFNDGLNELIIKPEEPAKPDSKST